MRRALFSILMLLTLSATAAAQDAPTKATLQAVCDAWASRDVPRAAQFYDQTPGDVFFDVAPLKYVGFAEYGKAMTEFYRNIKALSFRLNDDSEIHSVDATNAWSTATVQLSETTVDDKHHEGTARWTAIWQKKGGRWVIVHDHFSVPAQ